MTLPKIKLTGISALNLIGVLAIAYLVVVLAQTIKRNYSLGHQVDDLKAQMSLLQDQEAELNYNIQYYHTDSFRDQEARSKLGLQLPGESVIIIPSATPNPTPQPAPTAKSAAKPSNLQQWFNFLSGRSS